MEVGKNIKDVMANKLDFNNQPVSDIHNKPILSNSPKELISVLRNSIKNSVPWPQALIQTMAVWSLPNETFKGKKYIYLIDGECFNILLLAERLMLELKDLISSTDIENLLFKSEFPSGFDLSTLKYEIGITKYRGHVNFFYGVVVEEILQYTVEREIEKRFYSNGMGGIKNLDDETFKQLYKSKFDDLYTQFCIDTSAIKNKKSYFNEYIQFTYWLFKYRVTISDGAKIASDTKKALRHIVIEPQSCFAPVLFQLG